MVRPGRQDVDPSTLGGAPGEGGCGRPADQADGAASPLPIEEGAAVTAIAVTAVTMLLGSVTMAMARSDTFSAVYVWGMAVCLLGALPAAIGQLCGRRLVLSGTFIAVTACGRTRTYRLGDLQSAALDVDGVSLTFGAGVLRLRRASGGIGPWLAALRPMARQAFAEPGAPLPDPAPVAACLGLEVGQGLCCRLSQDRSRLLQLGLLCVALVLAAALAFWSLPGTSSALVGIRACGATLVVALLHVFWRACPSQRWSVWADADGLELRLDGAVQRQIPWGSVECVWSAGLQDPWIETACGHVVLDGGDANSHAILAAAQVVAATRWCRPGGNADE